MQKNIAPKKILRILNRFNVGGPTHNANYLTKYLSPDFETLLIAGNKLDTESSSEYILKNNNIKYRIIKSMNRSLNLFKDLQALFEIIAIIKEFKPDIVHTHASKSGAIGRTAALLCGVKVIVHTFHGHVFHSYFGKFKTSIYLYIEKFLAKRSSAIISISKLQNDELVNTFKICKQEKMHIIKLGFDLQKFVDDDHIKRCLFRKEFNLSEQDIAIGIIGRLTLIKDHKFFVSVASKVNALTNKKLKFFIIGDGEEKSEIEAHINKLGHQFISSDDTCNKESLFKFTSWRQDMDNIYSGLDIISLTSKNEGTPVTLIEGQAASRPVISTNVGGVADIVLNNESGYIAEVNDLEGFTSKLLNLIENNDLRTSMGAAGREHVIKYFTYERLVNDVRDLYNKIGKSI
jgi:glycosyltransferase involved in cell wall biosynthesis